MAFVTLYRFRVEVSDIDRGVYESLDFRAALHPSEAPVYLVTRVLAYALNCQEGLNFSAGGLSDPDAPALSLETPEGGVRLWIEIGNPSPEKLHRAAKAAEEVHVYTYKNPELLIENLRGKKLYRPERVKVFSFDPRILDRAVESLARDNAWTLTRSEGMLVLNLSESQVEETELRSHALPT